MVRAGQLSRRITIRTITLVPDGGGGSTEIPSDVRGIPARVEPLSGNERLDAMKIGMQRPYQFTLRYRTGLTGATRIVYDARTFDIKSIVDPEERHREILILADELVDVAYVPALILIGGGQIIGDGWVIGEEAA